MTVAPIHLFEPPAEPELTGTALEEAVRQALLSQLKLRVSVRAPTWRQVLFGGHPIEFKIPRAPDGSLDALDRSFPEVMPGDKVGEKAKAIFDGLRDSRPRGLVPRSLSARKPMPPARDAVAAWLRRVFLTTAGPEALRLLVAAGYLTSGDIDVIEAAYPDGLDGERTGLVEAAMALTAAAGRGGHDADLPTWLNDQVLTTMGEHRPVEFFRGLYKPEAPGGDEGQGGGSVGAPPSQIVDNTRPTTASEGR